MPDDLASNVFISIHSPRGSSRGSGSSFPTSEFASTTSNYLQMLNAQSKDVLKKRLSLKLPPQIFEKSGLSEADSAYVETEKKRMNAEKQVIEKLRIVTEHGEQQIA